MLSEQGFFKHYMLVMSVTDISHAGTPTALK